MGGAARVGHLHLRRRGFDRDRRRHPRAACGAGAGVLAGGGVRGYRGADPAVPGADVPVAGAVGRRRLDRARGEDGRCGGRRRRHHRILDPGQGGSRRHPLSAGLDPRHDSGGQGVHRHLHRHLGFHPRLHLDQSYQRDARGRQGQGGGDLGALPEVHSRFRADVPGRALPRARHLGRHRRPAAGGDRRGQHLPRHLLHPDLLLDRRPLQLQEAVAGGLRQARRGLSLEPVRLRDLGGPPDLLAVLQRREAAARRLNRRIDASQRNRRNHHVATEHP